MSTLKRPTELNAHGYGFDVPYDPSLPDTVQHISASQLKTFSACARKWYFQKVLRVRTQETPSMSLGRQVHSLFEAWASSGRLELPFVDGKIPAGAARALSIAQTGFQYLPDWRTERSRLYPELNIASATASNVFPCAIPVQRIGTERVPFVGFIDLLHVPKEGRPVVIDYKTTSGLHWALTPAQLKVDPQVIGYSRFVHLALGAREVDVKYIYLQTRKLGAAVSETTVDSAHIAREWGNMSEKVDRMVSLAREAPTIHDIGKVPYNTDECESYGGCPHRAACYGSSSPPGSDVEGRPSPGVHPFFTSLVSKEAIKERSKAVTTQATKKVNLLSTESPLQPPSGAPAAPPALTILVNCAVSVGPPAHPLEAVLAPMVESLEKAAGVPYLLALKFNEWRAPLVAALREVNFPPGMVVSMRSGSPITEQALEVFRARAGTLVIEGTR